MSSSSGSVSSGKHKGKKSSSSGKQKGKEKDRGGNNPTRPMFTVPFDFGDIDITNLSPICKLEEEELTHLFSEFATYFRTFDQGLITGGVHIFKNSAQRSQVNYTAESKKKQRIDPNDPTNLLILPPKGEANDPKYILVQFFAKCLGEGNSIDVELGFVNGYVRAIIARDKKKFVFWNGKESNDNATRDTTMSFGESYASILKSYKGFNAFVDGFTPEMFGQSLYRIYQSSNAPDVLGKDVALLLFFGVEPLRYRDLRIKFIWNVFKKGFYQVDLKGETCITNIVNDWSTNCQFLRLKSWDKDKVDKKVKVGVEEMIKNGTNVVFKEGQTLEQYVREELSEENPFDSNTLLSGLMIKDRDDLYKLIAVSLDQPIAELYEGDFLKYERKRRGL